ncbi:hypothetical protein GCM10007874_68020 [Labrys miyagiensis]|uniref:Uncharacterized protein n=1 Tax=Labrys miyagiensis TaxID=346912 RepID=A0ABQ6CZU4_9HYPH|nr:hypothetical protein [Labrys miyagiensis]GLS23781.1 hypothetical protein GCM10007874_68020 [Labrys miyagiensis]
MQAHWHALPNGPRDLTPKEQTALAGEYYRDQLAIFESSPHFDVARQNLARIGAFEPVQLRAAMSAVKPQSGHADFIDDDHGGVSVVVTPDLRVS